MKQDEAGRRLAWYLNRGVQDLKPDTLARLKAAREGALLRVDGHQEELSLAGLAGAGMPGQGYGRRGAPRRPMRLSLAVLVIAAVMVAFTVWLQTTAEPDVGALDAQLLGGDLPLHAYTHEDFQTWLQESH